jgi:hypothetical protein
MSECMYFKYSERKNPIVAHDATDSIWISGAGRLTRYCWKGVSVGLGAVVVAVEGCKSVSSFVYLRDDGDVSVSGSWYGRQVLIPSIGLRFVV